MFAKNLFNTFNRQSVSKNLLLGFTGFSIMNYYQQNYNKSNKVSCCGIIGAVSKKANVEDILSEGIQILQNRGYDSAGMTTVKKDQLTFNTTKQATVESSNKSEKIEAIDYVVDMAKENHLNSVCGIAHTRWATCGPKTTQNSHPHLDSEETIALVHNGTLDNYYELKDELTQQHSIKLNSDTDSELIAQICSVYMKEQKLSLKDAVDAIIRDEKIKGYWGIAAIDKTKPHQIVVARKSQPIEIGFTKDTIFVASEKTGFQNKTHHYVSVEDGESIELDINSDYIDIFKERIRIMEDMQPIVFKPRKGFEYFFDQEIHEQQQSVLQTIGMGTRLRGRRDSCRLGGLESKAGQLKDIDCITIIGCGSSYYASCFAATFLKRLGCMKSVQVIEGSEFQDYDLPVGNSAVVLVSQSGETADLKRALNVAQSKGVFSIGVINVVGSQIATNVDCGIYLNCGREYAVAATKSFTSQVSALIMMSVWLSQKRDLEMKQREQREKLVSALQMLPVTIASSLEDIKEESQKCAQFLAKQQTIICLGKGPCSYIAKEGALKLKELTYIHAEAFSAGELKHGPLALIDPERPKSTSIILIILDNEYLDDMNLCLSEVHSRNAQTLIITDCAEKINKNKSDFIFEIQNAGPLTSLLCVLAFQQITTEICKVKKINPDKPRNLAKCVTVK